MPGEARNCNLESPPTLSRPAAAKILILASLIFMPAIAVRAQTAARPTPAAAQTGVPVRVGNSTTGDTAPAPRAPAATASLRVIFLNGLTPRLPPSFGVPETDRRRARRGDPQAQYRLAVDNYRRRPPELRRAARWARRSAQQGYAAAEYLLAGLYSGGEGVPRDLVRAYRWASRTEFDAARPAYVLGCNGRYRLIAHWPPSDALDAGASATGLRLPASPRLARAAHALRIAIARRLTPAQRARARRPPAALNAK